MTRLFKSLFNVIWANLQQILDHRSILKFPHESFYMLDGVTVGRIFCFFKAVSCIDVVFTVKPGLSLMADTAVKFVSMEVWSLPNSFMHKPISFTFYLLHLRI